MERLYCVYVLASRRNGSLYVGVTNNIGRRAWEHREGHGAQFTRRYGVSRFVYFETHPDVRDAIAREKAIKGWHLAWKLRLIESVNPNWDDWYERLNG